MSHIGFGIGLSILGHVDAIVADHGPSVFPHHGFKIRHTANGASILEEDSPPLACLCLHQSPLVDMLIGKDPCGMLFIRSHRRFGAENGLRTFRTAIGRIDIVVVSDVIHVTALTSIAHSDDLLALLSFEVWGKTRDRDITDAAGHVDIAIAISAIIKEETGVVVKTVELLHLPLALRVCSRKHEVTAVIAKSNEINIELPVVVFQAWCPLALTVMILTVEQVVGIGIVDLL